MALHQASSQPQSTSVFREIPTDQPSEARSAPSLLATMLEANRVSTDRQTPMFGWLEKAATADPAELLAAWLQLRKGTKPDWNLIRRALSRDISKIDQLLTRQVNGILHTPEFQELEASWRGLHYLWKSRRSLLAESGLDTAAPRVDIRLLDVKKRELKKNFDAAGEFDQNEFFKKVYEEEFGTPGGTPYGMIIANYEFSNHPDDIDLLRQLSEVGASAFAPVITAAAPSLLGMDDFSTLERTPALEPVFQQVRHLKWNSLRKRVDTQFLGLTLPRILMRKPWQDDDSASHHFRFIEDTGDGTRRNFLWGNAAWAFGANAMRAFVQSGWFADIRGAEQGIEGGGLVANLPTFDYGADSAGVAIRSSVEACISDTLEAELCEFGFMPLCHCKDTEYSVFYSNQSVHKPEVSTDPEATANARLSSMLQYVLCCSRMAHYIKCHVRDKLGSQASADEIQTEINDWLFQYVVANSRASSEIKAKSPLQDASVTVEEIPGRPGEFSMVLRLLPHYQLDQLSSHMVFRSQRLELKP